MLAFLQELERFGARYLVIGAMALGFWGKPRATGDLDLWVDGREASRVLAAIRSFFGGADLGIDERDLREPGVLQLGYAPNRVDLVILEGSEDFDGAYARAGQFEYKGRPIRVASKEDIVRLKRAFGRPQDLADIAALEEDP